MSVFSRAKGIIIVDPLVLNENQRWFEDYAFCPKCGRMQKPTFHQSCNAVPAQHMHLHCRTCDYEWYCHPKDYYDLKRLNANV